MPPDQKTLRAVRQRLVTPEDEMRELLATIHGASHSPKARDIAGTLKGAVKDTFSGIYQNADEDTAWLSTAAYAGLVSGTSFKTRDLTRGKLTVMKRPDRTANDLVTIEPADVDAAVAMEAAA